MVSPDLFSLMPVAAPSLSRSQSASDSHTPLLEVAQDLPASQQDLPVLQGQAAGQAAAIIPSADREGAVQSHLSPWLSACVYPLGQKLVLPSYFGKIQVIGQENLPKTGSVILAPTHRSRWDAIMVPYAAGYQVTGRHLRFMVTQDEMRGLQGWFIRRLGGFPVDTRRPSVASLRHGIELLHQGEMVVIFPEGGGLLDNRRCLLNRLHPGLARLAIQAVTSQPSNPVQVVPIAIDYERFNINWGCPVTIRIGEAMSVSSYITGNSKKDAKRLTEDLGSRLRSLSHNRFAVN
ncbi:MAG: 1-acyl-sn-glycerol-3-phosphate acyltransferase [Synechococcales bacterium]|nr:1-acyl-sn-glycerol-3-phosphate acyltransferase [Synechococcales bacterium]